jgi:hypothetical protein
VSADTWVDSADQQSLGLLRALKKLNNSIRDALVTGNARQIVANGDAFVVYVKNPAVLSRITMQLMQVHHCTAIYGLRGGHYSYFYFPELDEVTREMEEEDDYAHCM